MDVFAPIVLGVGCLAIVIGVVVAAVAAGRHRHRQRMLTLQQWAARNEWTMVLRPPVDWGRRLPGRNAHGVSLAFAGTVNGRRVSVAEYSYTTTSTSSGADGATTTTTDTHSYVVTAVHLDRPSGTLGVQPRGVVSRVGRALFNTGSAIGQADFDKQYVVVGDPAAAAYRIPPALIAAHLDRVVPAWSLYGTDLLSWQPGRIGDPEHIPGFVAPLTRVADLLTRGTAP